MSKDDEAFLQTLVIPEEDRFKYTSQPWRGEYRWFRSPNVVCLERYQVTDGHFPSHSKKSSSN